MKLLFPAPVKPIMRINSLSFTEKVKFSKMVFLEFGYTKETFSNEIILQPAKA
jgi:hypothetical protein